MKRIVWITLCLFVPLLGCDASTLVNQSDSDGDAIEFEANPQEQPDGDLAEAEEEDFAGQLPDLDGDAEADKGQLDGDQDDESGEIDLDEENSEQGESDVLEEDGNETDAEAETPVLSDCERMGGSCAMNGCPDPTEEAASALGCAGVCCLDPETLPCVQAGGYCQTVDWETPLSYSCDASHYPAESSQGCEQFREWCCAPLDASCVAEGQMGSTLDAETTNDACCDGLTLIQAQYPANTGGCESGEEGSFLCTQCGNDRCDRFENECNCSADCAGAGACTLDGQDCPATTCRNRDSLWPWIDNECVQLTYTCDAQSHYCLRTESSYPGQTCNLSTGLCQER